MGFLGCKDGPYGLLAWPARGYSVCATGRCEPRRANLAFAGRGKHSERARRTDPPSGGLSQQNPNVAEILTSR
jgi:hypothetical protein